jgi:hypothetical protein
MANNRTLINYGIAALRIGSFLKLAHQKRAYTQSAVFEQRDRASSVFNIVDDLGHLNC